MIGRLASVAHRRKPHRRRRDGGERGVVLVYTALMAATIVGFAGFSVDFGRWYIESARVQNATDAAALGGVVQIATNFDDAESISRELLEGHGYPDDIQIGYGDSVNQMRVTTSSTVDNVFASIFGVEETTITRSALAEYLGPVPLGSPENGLGNDPDKPLEDQPDYWLNIAGPETGKVQGDRFATKPCGGGDVAECHSSNEPEDNADYEKNGYFFTIEVGELSAGDDLTLELFDGVMANVGSQCRDDWGGIGGWITGSQANDLEDLEDDDWVPPNYYDDADERYDGGNDGAQEVFCTGDSAPGGGSADVETTVVVRAPDDTPWLSTDNPVIDTDTCEPTTLGDYDIAGNDAVFDLLSPDDGDPDDAGEAVVNLDDDHLTFAETFRRWAPVCTIPSDEVQVGEYLVQIRTNVTATDPLTYDPDVSTDGHNKFAMRAGWDTDSNPYSPPNGTDVNLYAKGKLPLYANKEGADTEFYLSRIDERYQGRSLNIVFFDLGDAASAGRFKVLPPAEAEAGGSALEEFSGCSFFMDNGGTLDSDSSSCELRNVSRYDQGPYDNYQGRLVEVVVPIPEDYQCDEDDPNGCWIKVLTDFPGGTHDTTTWAAEVIGDPVRLVE